MEKKKLYKKIRYALGYPIIRIGGDFGLLDEQIDTYIEIAKEELDLTCNKYQKKLPKKVKEAFVVMLSICEVKNGFARTRLMYGTPDPDKRIINYEQLMSDAKETKELIHGLIEKLDIYYKKQ